MDSRTALDSGQLELYVLGALPEEQAAEIARLSRENPEILAEIESIEAALVRYAATQAPELKADTLEKALAMVQVPPASALEPGQPESRPRRVLLAPNWLAVWAAAASVALLISIGGLLWQQSQLQQVRADLNSYAAQLDIASQKLDVLNDPARKMVALVRDDTAHGGLVAVYFHPGSGQIHVVIHRLADLPEGLQYQLWGISGSTPIDAGVFDPVRGIQTLLTLKANVETFAITVEPEGGSPGPTSTPIMMGQVEL